MTEKAKRDADRSPMLVAAEAMESGILRYDALVTEAERAPLTSRKGIERAVRAMQEAAVLGEEMGRLVSALAEAISAMSARQSTRSQALLDRSREIKIRFDEMSALTERFDALAADAAKLNESVQSSSKMEGATDEAKAQFLRDLQTQMIPLIDRARELSAASATANFPEIEKQSDALAQTLLSAKNKVELAAKRLAP